MPEFYIKQNTESSIVTVACRLISDDDRQITLIPNQWVKVAECDAGTHVLRVGAILASGLKDVILQLQGGTFNENNKIEEIFLSPTDGGSYEIEVSP